MGGRAWSQEELIRLEELTEKYPLATVARKLNRSENAVFLKRQRTGIGGFIANTDMLTRNTLSRILGVENRTIQYWERKGLKSVRKKPYVMYRQQDIIRYMEEHPEDWNAARITDDSLFTLGLCAFSLRFCFLLSLPSGLLQCVCFLCFCLCSGIRQNALSLCFGILYDLLSLCFGFLF